MALKSGVTISVSFSYPYRFSYLTVPFGSLPHFCSAAYDPHQGALLSTQSPTVMSYASNEFPTLPATHYGIPSASQQLYPSYQTRQYAQHQPGIRFTPPPPAPRSSSHRRLSPSRNSQTAISRHPPTLQTSAPQPSTSGRHCSLTVFFCYPFR